MQRDSNSPAAAFKATQRAQYRQVPAVEVLHIEQVRNLGLLKTSKLGTPILSSLMREHQCARLVAADAPDAVNESAH